MDLVHRDTSSRGSDVILALSGSHAWHIIVVEMEGKGPNIKVIVFKAFVVASFALLAFQSWQLQIVQGEHYLQQADRNRFRLVSIDAPRGIIYDREGRRLARNMPSFTVSIVPADLPESQEGYVFQRVSTLLGIPVSSHDAPAETPPSIDRHLPSDPLDYQPEPQMKELVQAGRDAPFIPVPIESNVPRDLAFVVEEEHLGLPGVIVEIEPLREYISSTLTSHVIGYVGHIPEQEVEDYVVRDHRVEMYPRFGGEREGSLDLPLSFTPPKLSTSGNQDILCSEMIVKDGSDPSAYLVTSVGFWYRNICHSGQNESNVVPLGINFVIHSQAFRLDLWNRLRAQGEPPLQQFILCRIVSLQF